MGRQLSGAEALALCRDRTARPIPIKGVPALAVRESRRFPTGLFGQCAIVSTHFALNQQLAAYRARDV